MVEKQKIKDGNKCPTDVEKVHQILLEKGYYTEEELETIEISSLNIAQDKTLLEYKTNVIAIVCN